MVTLTHRYHTVSESDGYVDLVIYGYGGLRDLSTTLGQTATEGVDYVYKEQILVDGKNIVKIKINNDEFKEGDETFIFRSLNPQALERTIIDHVIIKDDGDTAPSPEFTERQYKKARAKLNTMSKLNEDTQKFISHLEEMTKTADISLKTQKLKAIYDLLNSLNPVGVAGDLLVESAKFVAGQADNETAEQLGLLWLNGKLHDAAGTLKLLGKAIGPALAVIEGASNIEVARTELSRIETSLIEAKQRLEKNLATEAELAERVEEFRGELEKYKTEKASSEGIEPQAFDDASAAGVLHGEEDVLLVVPLEGTPSRIVVAHEGNQRVVLEEREDSFDLVALGDGDDEAIGSTGDDVLLGMRGNDHLIGGEGDDQINGGSGGDTISDGPGDDVVYGSRGDDFIIAGAGDDELRGNSGTDTLSYADAPRGVVVDLIDRTAGGGAGSDTVLGFEKIIGSPYADDMTAERYTQELAGGAGDDRFTVLSDRLGRIAIDGGSGKDVLHIQGDAFRGTAAVAIGFGPARIDGREISWTNIETLIVSSVDGAINAAFGDLSSGWPAGIGALRFIGGTEDDRLNAVAISASDTLIADGGDGDDDLRSGAGADRITGGSGNDTIFAGAGADTIAGDLLANVVDLIGEEGNDTIYAGGGNDPVRAGAGDDLVYGGTGADTINGMAGRDKIYGEAGHDNLQGGLGKDLLYGGDGADRIQGGGGDDRLYGGKFADQLRGQLGADELFGDQGNDLLDGGDGDDILFGGVGDDELRGHRGDDRLQGMGGDDVLRGGEGKDTFVYAINEDLGDDRITDFNPEEDVIDLSGLFLHPSEVNVATVEEGVQLTIGDHGTITIAGVTEDQLEVPDQIIIA